MVDVAPVPERLEDAVCEAEHQKVAYGLLAQVVIDSVDLLLAEDLEHFPVQPSGRLDVTPKRLLDDDPPPTAAVNLVVQADPPELGDHLGEGRGLGGQVEQTVAAGPVLLVDLIEARGQPVERPGVGEVALVVDDPGQELVARGRLHRHPGIGLERLRDLCSEGGVVVRSPPDGDQHELVGQQVRPPQLVQRRDHLAMGQVAGRTEQDQTSRIGHPFQAETLAQRVVELGRWRSSLPCPAQAHLADGLRRIPGRAAAGCRLLRLRIGGDGQRATRT